MGTCIKMYTSVNTYTCIFINFISFTFLMGKTIAILGGQWGDEGKGKIVDFLTEKADVIGRATGGNNAGHTVVVGGEKFKFHFGEEQVRITVSIGFFLKKADSTVELSLMELFSEADKALYLAKERGVTEPRL